MRQPLLSSKVSDLNASLAKRIASHKKAIFVLLALLAITIVCVFAVSFSHPTAPQPATISSFLTAEDEQALADEEPAEPVADEDSAVPKTLTEDDDAGFKALDEDVDPIAVEPVVDVEPVSDTEPVAVADEPAVDVSSTSRFYSPNFADDLIASAPFLMTDSCKGHSYACYQTPQYSGYLLARENREIHYWFVQASVEDFATRPVFVWTNGGPGCSGLEGALAEHGPYTVMEDNKIYYNPFSWNTEVNMLYLEQPYGVGFSVPDAGKVVGGDQNAADDMDAVIRNFIMKFPQFVDNEVYLSSESWGGHYVPMTTATIMHNNEDGAVPFINLKGFLLGNPFTNENENAYGFVGGLYAHGILDSTDWDIWRSECWDNTKNLEKSDICGAIYIRGYKSVTNIDPYALDFPNCVRDASWDGLSAEPESLSMFQHHHIHRMAITRMQRLLSLNTQSYKASGIGMSRTELNELYTKVNSFGDEDEEGAADAVGANDDDSANTMIESHYVVCSQYHLTDYLNTPQVQEGLHVKRTKWGLCSNEVSAAWPESDYGNDMQTVYAELVDKYAGQLKMMIFSGDDDSVCGLQGTQYWMDRIPVWTTDAENDWQAWSDSSQQLGGFYTKYVDMNGVTAMHFSTVHSAGHMVPSGQPRRALDMLRKFLYEYE